MDLVCFVLILALALYVLACIKQTGKYSRLVFYTDGKPRRVAGPGFVFVWHLLENTKLLDVGDHLLPLPEVELRPQINRAIVSGNYIRCVVDPLRAAAGANVTKATEEAVASTLRSILPRTALNSFLLDRSGLEKRIAQEATELTKAWGVAVSHVTIHDCPVARTLLFELVTIPTVLAMQLESVAEQAAETEPCN